MRRFGRTLGQVLFLVWFAGFSLGWVYYGWEIDHEQPFGVAMLTGTAVAGYKALVWPYTITKDRQTSIQDDEKRAYWKSMMAIQEEERNIPDAKASLIRIQEDRKLKGDDYADNQLADEFESTCKIIKRIRPLFVAIHPPEEYQSSHVDTISELNSMESCYEKVVEAARAHNHLALSLAFDNFTTLMASYGHLTEFTATELRKYGPAANP